MVKCAVLLKVVVMVLEVVPKVEESMNFIYVAGDGSDHIVKLLEDIPLI